jgi:hypothetical protein
MNVPYNQISTKDAAQIIGVCYSSVAAWCTEGLVPYTDVSGGTGKKRYMLNEEDVNLLKKAKQKYGNRMLKHVYNDGVKLVPVTYKDDEKPVASTKPTASIKPVKQPSRYDDEPIKARPAKVDIDEIAITIGEIQDRKEELENLEARKAQILAELEELRNKVMEAL